MELAPWSIPFRPGTFKIPLDDTLRPLMPDSDEVDYVLHRSVYHWSLQWFLETPRGLLKVSSLSLNDANNVVQSTGCSGNNTISHYRLRASTCAWPATIQLSAWDGGIGPTAHALDAGIVMETNVDHTVLGNRLSLQRWIAEFLAFTRVEGTKTVVVRRCKRRGSSKNINRTAPKRKSRYSI